MHQRQALPCAANRTRDGAYEVSAASRLLLRLFKLGEEGRLALALQHPLFARVKLLDALGRRRQQLSGVT